MHTATISETQVILLKQRLAENKAFHERPLAERMEITINQAAKTIEFDVIIRGNSFLAAFLDWRETSTLGIGSVEKVKQLAIKLVNHHDANMLMYK